VSAPRNGEHEGHEGNTGGHKAILSDLFFDLPNLVFVSPASLPRVAAESYLGWQVSIPTE
jgi:hypothetical protein